MGMSFKLAIILWILSSFTFVYGACGGTVRTWDAGNNTVRWDRVNNWNANNVPDTPFEDALIVSAARPCRSQMNATIGCLEIMSGELQTRNNRTLTIQGDYFKNLNANSLQLDSLDDWYLVMDGNAAQTLENVDPLNHLEISNDTSVTFTNAFEIRTSFTLSGSGSTVYVNDDLTLSFWSNLSIPSTVTIEIAAGKTMTVASDITVGGTLILNAGASLVMASGTTLTVSSGGLLKLNGASGNAAAVSGNGGYIDILVNGDIWANYFRMDRVGANNRGLEISGTVQSMNYGEFHFISNTGYGMTFNSSASIPSNIDGIGFYDDNAYGNNYAINAGSYDVSDVIFDDWGGINSENDPNERIDWGTQAGTVLTLSTNTNLGYPFDPVFAGEAAFEFVIFSFALNQASASTDITEITFTLTGSAESGDVDYIQVFNQGASCQTQGTQIGSDLIMSGDPAQATITIPPSTISVNSTAPRCIHVYLKTTDSAENSATLGVKIDSTDDVINDYGYSFSETSGPPVSGTTSTISGDTTVLWKARNSGQWRVNQNWQNGGWPNTTENCRIGSAPLPIELERDEGCQNLNLSSAGEIDWNASNYSLTATGTLNIENGFIFTDVGSTAALVMGGSSNQSMTVGTTFPGDLEINNSGGASSIISVNGDSAISGDLTITSGLLKITSGVTLTVDGNVTVANGAILDIESNGTLKLGNGSTLTVSIGGTLEMVGDANEAIFTSSGAAEVVINGTIRGNKYIFDRLGTNGVTINSGATIDSTDNLINGTFKHPVNDGSTLLRLYRAIPSNTLSNMTFDMNGSSATASTITNIYTDNSIGAGTLMISSYTGDLGGASQDDDNNYLISWSGASNTIDLYQAMTGPGSVYQGQTYHMGRFSFKQNLAGASYVDANITSLTLTLTGTGSANDIDAVRIYYDSDCNSAGGVQLAGAGSFSGNPAKITFAGLTGAIVEADTANPPTRCIYVEFDIDANATNAATIGVEISAAADVIDDQSYGISSGTPPPVDLGADATIIGSSTTWTGGAGTTDWFTAGNWNGGVPTSSLNCIINNSILDPIISSGVATCNSIDIGNGSLTLSLAATLEIYGSFTSTGTFNDVGTLRFVDDGITTTNQAINIAGNTLQDVIVDKDAGGMVFFESSSFTIGNLTMSGSNNNYTFQVGSGQNLTLTSGVTIDAGMFRINSAGVVEVGNGQTILVSGGHFWCNGTADSSPQNLGTKAKVTVSGMGTWAFNSSSGIVEMKGFHLDYMDTNGLRIGGTTILSQLDGGQFTNLSNSYSSVRAISLNTTGSIPISSTNVGWNWMPNNTTPANTDNYTLVYSSGCASQSIDVTGWFGDWYEGGISTFDVSSKVNATNCTVTLSGSATPVSLIEFYATPFNNAVELNWKTSLEIDHLGFNVYRKSSLNNELVQINSSLIRSMGIGHEGVYQFSDWNVENSISYYYYIEDVAVNGDTRLHGPVMARPDDGLGMPQTTNDEMAMDFASNHIPEISIVQHQNLGGGISIISKTMNSIRLQINPGQLQFEVFENDSNYSRIMIDGYARMLEGGAPELLEKVILIEVDSNTNKAKISDSNIEQILYEGQQIASALVWVSDDDHTPHGYWELDQHIYTKDKFYLSENIEVANRIISVGQKKYLKIIVRPVNYNPVSRQLTKIQSATVDIGLNGEAWAYNDNDLSSVYMIENGLKLAYSKEGFYRLDFDQLEEMGVDGPFAGADIQDIKVYYYGHEIPIEIASGDEYFSNGDSIRFYLKYVEALEDIYNYAILKVDQGGDDGKRIESVDAHPDLAIESEIYESMYEAIAEENNLVQLRDPMGTYIDHFFWKRIYAPYGQFESESYLVMPVDLKGIDPSSDSDVEIDLYVKGTHDGYNLVFNHHIGIYINNAPNMVADANFHTNEYMKIKLTVPSYYFYDGVNYLNVKVLGDLVPEDHYDLVYIDKAVVRYFGRPYLDGGQLIFKNLVRDSIIEVVSSFAADIYDISDLEEVKKIESASVVHEGDVFLTSFWANSEEGRGRKFLAQVNGQENDFAQFELIYGYSNGLVDVDNRADMIIIGAPHLLDVSNAFVQKRTTEGLEVELIDINQIYDEFSSGKISSQAIREFIEYAYFNWGNRLLKYVLILGDASYDFKDNLGYGVESGTTPIPLVKGQLYDFPSDNWFVTGTDDESNVPVMAIGRIPTNDPIILARYFDKLAAYEDGQISSNQARKMFFFSDRKSSKENFSADIQIVAPDGIYQNSFFSRDDYNDQQMHQNVIEAFDVGPLVMGFMGHGAMRFWAHKAILSVESVGQLENSVLPIVASFNCSNGNFTDPNVSMTSLGEELVFHDDGGAIAFLGSVSMPTPTAQKQFANHFFNQFETTKIVAGEPVRLGDLFMKAKNELGDSVYGRDVQNSYVIIGDPSLRLPEAAFAHDNSSVGGGGCDANASDGAARLGWQQAIFELFLMLLIPFVFRFTRRFK